MDVLSIIAAAVAGYFLRGVLSEHTNLRKKLQDKRAERLIKAREEWLDLMDAEGYKGTQIDVDALNRSPVPRMQYNVSLLADLMELGRLKDLVRDDDRDLEAQEALEEMQSRVWTQMAGWLREYDRRIGYTELRGPAAIPTYLRAVWHWFWDDMAEQVRTSKAAGRLRRRRRRVKQLTRKGT